MTRQKSIADYTDYTDCTDYINYIDCTDWINYTNECNLEAHDLKVMISMAGLFPLSCARGVAVGY